MESAETGSWHPCHVLDISLIGAGVELMGPVPPDVVGRRLVVETQAPTGGSISLRLTGECRNVSPGLRGGMRVGVEFTELSEAERSILAVLKQMQVVW